MKTIPGKVIQLVVKEETDANVMYALTDQGRIFYRLFAIGERNDWQEIRVKEHPEQKYLIYQVKKDAWWNVGTGRTTKDALDAQQYSIEEAIGLCSLHNRTSLAPDFLMFPLGRNEDER